MLPLLFCAIYLCFWAPAIATSAHFLVEASNTLSNQNYRFFLGGKKYDEEWKTAKSESEDCDADLQSIQEECEKANATIKKGSKNFISSAGLLAQVSYWIGAIGIDRLSRRGKISWDGLGKIRQATKNIDDIFAEVCYLSIDPSSLS